MTPEQKAAYVIGQAACLMAEVAAMQADNQYCLHAGVEPKHGAKDFHELIAGSGCHHNAVIGLFHGH